MKNIKYTKWVYFIFLIVFMGNFVFRETVQSFDFLARRSRSKQLNTLGMATALKEDGEFMDPVEILDFAIINGLDGVLQVYIDEQAVNRTGALASKSEEAGVFLICHSFLGTRRNMTEDDLRAELMAAQEILCNQDRKLVVFHYEPSWSREELLSFLKVFEEAGITPCIENPLISESAAPQFLEDIVFLINEDIDFNLVVDFGKIFSSEIGNDNLTYEDRVGMLNSLMSIIDKNNIPFIAHIMDSTYPDFSIREYYCPAGEGRMPYKDVILPLIVGVQRLMQCIVFEYEDANKVALSVENWHKILSVSDLH
ncbi:MAG: hypothetical protein P9M06_05070 [Candidatus Saelkia tenebricola]|nr:hypothetical protein [Candidatus Saelkia tenebricola]